MQNRIYWEYMLASLIFLNCRTVFCKSLSVIDDRAKYLRNSYFDIVLLYSSILIEWRTVSIVRNDHMENPTKEATFVTTRIDIGSKSFSVIFTTLQRCVQ